MMSLADGKKPKTRIVDGEHIMSRLDVCEYLGISPHKLLSAVIRNIFPASDGYVAPEFGRTGPRGKFWYLKTVMDWETNNWVDFSKRINTKVLQQTPPLCERTTNMCEQTNVDLSSTRVLLGNLIATQLGLTTPDGDETLNRQDGRQDSEDNQQGSGTCADTDADSE